MDQLYLADCLTMEASLLFALLDESSDPTLLIGDAVAKPLYYNRAAAWLVDPASTHLLAQLVQMLPLALIGAMVSEVNLLIHLEERQHNGEWQCQASRLQLSQSSGQPSQVSWLLRLRPAGDPGNWQLDHLQQNGLSRREAEVVLLAAEGLSNAEIAARLTIGTQTAAVHLRNSYLKLGVHRRTALAALLRPAGSMAQEQAGML